MIVVHTFFTSTLVWWKCVYVELNSLTIFSEIDPTKSTYTANLFHHHNQKVLKLIDVDRSNDCTMALLMWWKSRSHINSSSLSSFFFVTRPSTSISWTQRTSSDDVTRKINALKDSASLSLKSDVSVTSTLIKYWILCAKLIIIITSFILNTRIKCSH